MENQIVNADKEVDYRDAEKTLRLYLKEKDMSIKNCEEWTRWNYSKVPFWSVWGLVYGCKEPFINFCGIHIYDNGRVLIVSTLDK